MVWEMNILTPEEEAEFTPLNAVAYDLYRKVCQEKNIITVCWLCISDEIKHEIRDALYKWLDINIPSILPYRYENASILMDKLDMNDVINKWKEAEIAYKQYRIDGNPKAYFAN